MRKTLRLPMFQYIKAHTGKTNKYGSLSTMTPEKQIKITKHVLIKAIAI